MDPELRAYLAIARRLPRLKGAGVVANAFKRVYGRKPRGVVATKALGFDFELEPNEAVDREVLFAPQLYDHPQVRFMLGALKPGDTFVDTGANIGFYTLLASRAVGPTGRVIAIDADPYNFGKLRRHLDMNGAKNVTALPIGVSDKRQTLELTMASAGNRGGSTFAFRPPDHQTVAVECYPLKDVLDQQGVTAVAGLKMDIEGWEYRVMKPFFEQAPRAMWPRFAIMERHPGEEMRKLAGGDVIDLMKSLGYELVWWKDGDFVLRLPR